MNCFTRVNGIVTFDPKWGKNKAMWVNFDKYANGFGGYSDIKKALRYFKKRDTFEAAVLVKLVEIERENTYAKNATYGFKRRSQHYDNKARLIAELIELAQGKINMWKEHDESNFHIVYFETPILKHQISYHVRGSLVKDLPEVGGKWNGIRNSAMKFLHEETLAQK